MQWLDFVFDENFGPFLAEPETLGSRSIKEDAKPKNIQEPERIDPARKAGSSSDSSKEAGMEAASHFRANFEAKDAPSG